MRKRGKINKKIVLSIITIILLVVGYYIYYINSNIYEEFETSSEIQELVPYEDGNLEKKNTEMQETKNVEEKAENAERIIVHITGQVKNWGVIELEKGSRVIDAVDKAGGFTEEADTEKVNLAYELTDGVKIYIPSKNVDEESNISTQKYITTDSGDNSIMEEKEMRSNNNSLLININEATQTELETLPGIGPSIALKIISYRKEHGNFSSIEDIKNVSGIGDNKFENIRELICV